ncbi:endolytic transglycosylase MltG [Actinomadura sp. DC4]|uniref:endolytic transglycosylase MltG n=1 Tax=Actinomadura sp. DC4 TaxID=3055069 RepID=UPI0025AF466F|nr:endolytic transglycosylase MltG [Actinomadura sp. DC4]MDN3358051.1 endolytic transglycosylase MltG [Actinomadura sp. DC4]
MSDADLDFLRQLAERQRSAHAGGNGGGRGARGHRGRRRKKNRRGRKLAPVIAIIFLVAVVGGGGYLGFTMLSGIVHPPDYDGPGTGSVTVQIQDGDSVRQMGQRLQQADVIKSSSAFYKIAKSDPKATSIQPGYYQLKLRMSAKGALALLLSPASRTGRVTFPEGKRAAQVLSILAARTHIPLKNFQRVAQNPKGLGLPSYAHGRLEGFLYPFTYDPAPDATATQVLRAMVTQFKKVAADIDLEGEAQRNHMSPHDVVVIASLVQAESGTSEDMPKISRVIDNRLHNSQLYLHKLQLDSTVMYALGKYGIVASGNDLKSTSPYNTYANPGLPPGAISNPGEDALKAALNPAKGPWTYFVTTDPKRHVTKFTDNFTEFERFRQELQQNLAHG